MAREQGFSITVKAWAKVDRKNPHSMMVGAELADGKSIEHALAVLGLVDIVISSNYTSKVAPALPATATPETLPPAPAAEALAEKPFDPVADMPAHLRRVKT